MKRFLIQILNPWIIFGAIVIGIILVLSGLFILRQTQITPEPIGDPKAEVSLIEAPTMTARAVAAPGSTPTETLDIPPPPPPGTFAAGAIVQIAGTGGEGLNLRNEPGLNTNIQYLGFESEVFTIFEGPVEKDGLTWWYIVGFSDDTRTGWAAANFLEIVQTP